MDYSHNSRDEAKLQGSPEAARDALWRDLLLSAEAPASQLDQILPWNKVLHLVDRAPAERVAWPDLVFGRVSRQARFALAAVAMAFVGAGSLAVMPAQSDQIGTVVLAKVPVAWQAGGPELAEVQAAAESRFSSLSLSDQADMYFLPLKAAENETHPTLAIAFLNVEANQAEQLFDGLAEQYPGLRSGEPKFKDIQSQVFENRLQELLGGLREPGRFRGLGEAQIRSEVLRQLRGAGLSPDSINVQRTPEGGLRIEISASMDINVDSGHVQEALDQIGLSREILGDEAFEQLTELQQAQ